MPLVDVRKVVALKFGPGFNGRNRMLRLLDDLVIEQYGATRAASAIPARRKTEIFRTFARKDLLGPISRPQSLTVKAEGA